MLGIVKKRPGDNLDYDVDFSDWLVDGDIIASGLAVSSGVVVVGDVEVMPTVVKVWLSGGESGETSNVTVTVTTGSGRIKEAVFAIRISEC